jgi:Family of unknown function (DUF6282)
MTAETSQPASREPGVPYPESAEKRARPPRAGSYMSHIPRPDLDLLKGWIDMHAHTYPALFNRHIDDMDLAEIALDFGMRGFVLKDHDMQTAGRAYHVHKLFPELDVFGGVVLNRSVGGINPHVVQSAIHYGGKVIWMPSNHSKWHAEYFHISDYPQFGRPQRQIPGPGVTVLDENGQLTPETLTVLDIIAEADVVLATGHLSLPEIRLLQDEATRRGVKRFLVTHANWALCRLEPAVQRELIEKGAVLEYVAVSCSSATFWEQNPEELAGWINELGPEHLIISSDLGQIASPSHAEGVRMMLRGLLEYGVPPEALAKMTQINPARLLGLD